MAQQRARRRRGACALAVWLPPLAFVDVPQGGRLVSYDEGVLATVSVVEDSRGVARLHINNRQQEGSSATFYADGRQGLLPLLLHPAPRRALFLGLGTGVTAAAAAAEPVAGSRRRRAVARGRRRGRLLHASARPPPRLASASGSSRPMRAATCARRDQRYDVIVSDNFHPARSGSASLYTVEHFAAVRERLAAGGLFCQWLPLHQLDLATLRSIVRSFLAAFPQGTALLASYSLDTPVLGLVARPATAAFDVDDVRARLATAQREGRSPEDYGVGDDLALLGGFIAGPRALARVRGRLRRSTPTTARRRLSRAARHVRARGCAARPVARATGDAWPSTPDELSRSRATRRSSAASRRTGRRATDSSRPAATCVRRATRAHAGAGARAAAGGAAHQPGFPPRVRSAAGDGARGRAVRSRAARALLAELHDVQPARLEAGEALRALDGAQR